MIVAAHDRGELRYLGAGPLEDLLSFNGHGVRFLEAIVARVTTDERWATSLADVWLTEDVPVDVRHRLARLGARDFVAEHAMSEDEQRRYFAERARAGFDLPEDRC